MDPLKYPNVPAYAQPKPKKRDTTTANGLTQWVLDYCHARGIHAIRTGNEGKFRPGKTVVNVLGHKVRDGDKWLPGDNPGLADIHICRDGRFIAVEIKIGRDRQSEPQMKYQRRVESAGGQYWIVTTPDDFTGRLATQ
jgi:hypothetical protein